MDEVDEATRCMFVVKCGGCRWRRRSGRQWRCNNSFCPSFEEPVTKESHQDCPWWDARSLLRSQPKPVSE